ARDLAGRLRTVLFAPEDLSLVKGDPAGRRRFLDELLVLLSPKLAGVRSEYERVIRQRNALLKSAGPQRRSGAGLDLRTLAVWASDAAGAGGRFVAERRRSVPPPRAPVEPASPPASAGQGHAGMFYPPRVGDPNTTDARLGEEDPTAADMVEARLLAA